MPIDLHVVLVHPQIPPNTGTIARLCGATNTTLHLIEPIGFDISEKAVKRAGLDYWDQVKINVHPNFEAFITEAQKIVPTLFTSTTSDALAFFSKKAPKNYWQAKFEPTQFLVFGSEQTGLPEEVLEAYPKQLFSVPMYNSEIRSLNLAVTCGIVLYECLRQLQIDSP